MRLLIMTVSLWALAYGKPEMYKEKEDFQYSRSSSDDGSKAGYYGAQRGNMGGNYEKAHNMDSLAQNQMSTLVRQVDGELGAGANTRTGSVFTAGNSRGVYGSGQYDLSNLKGRRFDEGEAYSDTYSSASKLQNSDYYRNSYSGANNARYTTNQLHGSGLSSGYETAGLASQYAQANNQQAESQYQGSSNYEYGRQGGSNYRYYTHGGSQARSDYDLRNTNSESGNSYDANTRSRLISTTPVRVYIRPGTRVAIPVGAQTYDTSHSSIAQEQSAVNSEAELLNSGSRINIIKPASNAKHYESSYSYKKEWEKHDAQPLAVLSTESPFSANSELYEEGQLSQAAGQQYLSEADSTNAQSRRTSSAHSSNVNTAYSSGYNANTKSATSNRLRYQSQLQNSGASSASNLYAVDTNGIDSGASANLNSFVDANTRPKNYQSSYSYHKSWERRGDPYVIKPVGDLTSQMSQRLTDEYGLNYHQHGVAAEDCGEEHRRQRRSDNLDPYQHYTFHPHNFHEGQQELGQQTMDNWAYLGQQTDSQWDNLENLGQQTQDKWDNLESVSGQNLIKEELGQQSQSQWGNLEQLGQQTQNTWNNLENLNQQSESQIGKLENEGQQTQNTWNNLENLNQQTQNQNEGLEYLGQETQSTSDKLESFDQKDQKGKLEDLGQQTQDTWAKLETLGQQTQNKWDKFDTFDQQTQNQWDKTENNWQKVEDLHQQTRKTEEQLSTANIEEIEQQNQNIIDFLKIHQQVMQDLNKYPNSFKPQYNVHQNTQVNNNHEYIKPLDEIHYGSHQHSGNRETDIFPHIFDSNYHSTPSLTPNRETFIHKPSPNNNDLLWDSVDKLIQESEKKESNDNKKWDDSESTFHHNYFTSDSQEVYDNGHKEEVTTEKCNTNKPEVIDEPTIRNEFFSLNKSDGTNDNIKNSSPEESTESHEIKEPEDIGRGDIGADDVPTVSIAEHSRNIEKSNTDLQSHAIHEISTLKNEEPIILDIMGLEQQYNMIPTSTHKPKQSDHIDLYNMQTLPNDKELRLKPKYKQQGNFGQDKTSEITEQQNLDQQFDNLEETIKQDQSLADFGQQTQTNNLFDQSLVDFGQQDQTNNLKNQFLVDFGQQTQANNWHDQSLVDFGQQTQTNNKPTQSLVDFGQQAQTHNMPEQSLVDFGQQAHKNNLPEQSLVDFEQQTQTNNMPEQSLVDFGQQVQLSTTNMNENLQQFSQTNLEPLENFETQNIEIPCTNDKQVLSQNAKNLEMSPQNNEKLQSDKYINENVQEPSQNNFNQFDSLIQDEKSDRIQKQQKTEKNSKSQNVEKLEQTSGSIPEQPLEVTEKPGFWSSVWNKTVKAKNSVASWFKS